MPAAIQALIAALFVVSLRGGGSLFYDAAKSAAPVRARLHRALLPQVDAGVRGRVRAAGGRALVWLAFAPPAVGLGRREPASGSGRPCSPASLVDWCVRKWWFRYFGPGPLDQLLKRVLPPENTAAGRRSLDYIRRMRAELGMPPP